jgi:putative sporulation protein YtaF
LTVERNPSHQAEPIARQISLRIADDLLPEKLPTTVVPAGILRAAATLLLMGFVLEQIIQAAKGANSEWNFQIVLYAILIALTNNVDNLGARIAYSLQGTRVSVLVNLWISVITFVISLAAAASGAAAIGWLGTQAASVVAMVFLVAIGSWMIFQALKPASREEKPARNGEASLWTVLLEPDRADVDRSRHIDFKEGSVLGIALSINNIGGGLSGGIMGVNPVLVALLSALVSFVALWAGNYLAEYFVKRNITEKAAVVGGVLLIAIGIKQIF